MTLRRRTPLLVAAATVAALLVAVPVSEAQAPAHRVAAVAWADGSPSAVEGTVVTLRVTLAPGAASDVMVRVAGATVVGLPDA